MQKRHYIVPFFIPHVGCPYRCVFCNQIKITGKQDIPPPHQVIPTIKRYRSTFRSEPGRVEAAFFGGSFTGIPVQLQVGYLKEARSALQSGLIDGIRLSTRPDYIDEGVLNRLEEYGVGTIELGVQSMDDEVLSKSRRGHSSADVRRAVEYIGCFDFKLGLQMMIGLPGDTPAADIKTALEICSLKPDFVRIYPTLILRGTELETMYDKGLYRPLELDRAVGICEEIMVIFIREGIEIIRIGLQTTQLINAGRDVVAGPFHPAFRQLVDAAVIRKAVLNVMGQLGGAWEGSTLLEANPSMISAVVGVNRDNIRRLREVYPGMEFKVASNKYLDKTSIRFNCPHRVFEIDYHEVIKNS